LGAEVRDTDGPGLVLLVQLGKRSPLVSHHSTRFRGCTVAALGVDGLIIPIAMPIRPSLIGNLYDQATPTKRSAVRIHTKANQEPAVKTEVFPIGGTTQIEKERQSKASTYARWGVDERQIHVRSVELFKVLFKNCYCVIMAVLLSYWVIPSTPATLNLSLQPQALTATTRFCNSSSNPFLVMIMVRTVDARESNFIRNHEGHCSLCRGLIFLDRRQQVFQGGGTNFSAHLCWSATSP
jgi:hypothetical protein